MSKKTAFGGKNDYRVFKAEGTRIANTVDLVQLEQWIKKLNSEDSVVVQQAAAVCYAVGDISPGLFRKYQEVLIEVLKKNVHPAGPRFTFRLLTEIPIDEEYKGVIIDLSFKSLLNPSSPVAIKVFAMTVIANQLKQYPDLGAELEAALQLSYSNGSAGFKNRAIKIANAHGLKIEENM